MFRRSVGKNKICLWIYGTFFYLSLLPERSYILEAATQAIIDSKQMEVTFTNPELFATEIAPVAMQCYVLFDPMQEDNKFQVTAIKKDAEGQPIGLIFSPPDDLSFPGELEGETEPQVPMIRSGMTIAWIENVICPHLGL